MPYSIFAVFAFVASACALMATDANTSVNARSLYVFASAFAGLSSIVVPILKELRSGASAARSRG
jgi:hypothetical protein